MKNCTHCKFAEWRRTAGGKFHPCGDGKCGYPYKLPPLPASMYWLFGLGHDPKPSGGHINRRKELENHCAYWQQKEGAQ